MSTHKCRHCGDDIRSVRLWLPRPAGEPFWLPPPFETAYASLEDGARFCRLDGCWYFDELDGLVQAEGNALPHQPMPRIQA